MNKNRKTSHILNVFQFDANGHVILPATLTIGENPHSSDNTSKIPSTSWIRTYVTGLSYLTGNQSITVSGDATGSGTTAITLTLANTAVTPGTYGSTTLVPVVTVDSKGRITSVTTAAISGSLTFTGDVTGTGTTGTSTGLTLAASGVTAGTYTKVTVDSKGRVTVGANASTTDISEGTNLYYTDTRVGTYLTANSYATQSYVTTQVSNLVAAAPATLDTLNELAAALGNDPSFATTVSTSIGTKVPQARTITINGTTYDLTANRSWTITSMIYPAAGIALSTGTGWGTSITDNSANWNTAYGWGNHASGGYLTSATAATTYASLTGAYANPAFISSLAYSKITGVPAFLTSYTETDPYRVTSVAVSGTSTKTITLTRADASTVTTTWTDIDTDTNTYVTSAGFSGGTLTLTRNDAGTVTVSLDGRYYLATNPSGYITGITSSNVTTALGYTPYNSTNPSGYITTSSLTWSNISGKPTALSSFTNDLGNYGGWITGYTETDTLASVTGRGATTTAAITVTASEGREVAVYMPSSYTTNDLVSGHEYGWYDDNWRLGMTRSGAAPGGDFVIQWNAARRLSLTNGGNLTVTGTISASNLSGTNTGDQTLSGLGGVPTSRTLTINGTAYDLTTDRSWTISGSDSSKLPLAGGTMTGTIGFSNVTGNKIDFYYSGDDRYGIQVQNSELRIHSGAQGASDGGITFGKSTGSIFTEHLRIRNDGNVQVVVGSLSMATSGTSYIRMGRFPNSTSNSGEAWIGRASDRNAGTMTVQLGGGSASSRSFEVVDYAWSTVLFSVNSNGNISASGTVTGSNLSGTNTGDQTNISGNAATATKLASGQTTWSGTGIIDSVVGMLAWKNYGNSHVIFDASQSTSPSGTAVNNTNAGTAWTAAYPTLMGWNGAGTYGVRVDSARIADSASSVAWGNVSGRPTAVSSFTNDSGYLTSVGIGNMTDVHRLFNNMGNTHGTYQDFNSVGNFGVRYMQGSTNGPQGGQHYGFTLGLGNDYTYGTYGTQFYWLRNTTNPYIYIRYQEAGSWGSWTKAAAGYADSAGSASTATSAGSVTNGMYLTGTQQVSGQKQFQSDRDTSSNSAPLQAFSMSGGATMAFHRSSVYATNFGLDSDNVIRIGGWSASNNRLQMDMSGNLTMAGDVTAYSDARVKENIATIENALNKVLALRGVSYNRIDSDDKKTKIGVIAQETLLIVPEVVNQDNDGMFNVSYGNLAGLFIEAIKEQQKEIEELKTLIYGITR